MTNPIECPVCGRRHAPDTVVEQGMNSRCFNKYQAELAEALKDETSAELYRIFKDLWDRDYLWKRTPYLSVKADKRAMIAVLEKVVLHLIGSRTLGQTVDPEELMKIMIKEFRSQ